MSFVLHPKPCISFQLIKSNFIGFSFAKVFICSIFLKQIFMKYLKKIVFNIFLSLTHKIVQIKILCLSYTKFTKESKSGIRHIDLIFLYVFEKQTLFDLKSHQIILSNILYVRNYLKNPKMVCQSFSTQIFYINFLFFVIGIFCLLMSL